ncbi:MAG TPA: hypothetical protein VGM94_05145 [Galbitalea sp.]|jgi:hypothetical protein
MRNLRAWWDADHEFTWRTTVLIIIAGTTLATAVAVASIVYADGWFVIP